MATIAQIQANITAQSTALDALTPLVTVLASVSQAQLDVLATAVAANDSKIAALTMVVTPAPAA